MLQVVTGGRLEGQRDRHHLKAMSQQLESALSVF